MPGCRVPLKLIFAFLNMSCSEAWSPKCGHNRRTAISTYGRDQSVPSTARHGSEGTASTEARAKKGAKVGEIDVEVIVRWWSPPSPRCRAPRRSAPPCAPSHRRCSLKTRSGHTQQIAGTNQHPVSVGIRQSMPHGARLHSTAPRNVCEIVNPDAEVDVPHSWRIGRKVLLGLSSAAKSVAAADELNVT